jgi:hypothetical protein
VEHLEFYEIELMQASHAFCFQPAEQRILSSCTGAESAFVNYNSPQ